MPDRPTVLLQRLERVIDQYGAGAASRKLELIRDLRRRRLPRSAEVLRLHEALCFLRAFPDSRDVRALVDASLREFPARADLRRHRSSLADSGIAGTPIDFSFFWVTASWLAGRWPERLSIDWPSFEKHDRLQSILHLLVPFSETPALDELDFETEEWIERLKGPDDSDAAFVIRRFAALPTDAIGRETFYEDIDVPIHLEPGPDTPNRTHPVYPRLPVVYQRKPLSRERPSIPEAVRVPPRAIRSVSRREAGKLIDLARGSMVTRSRDLDAFAHADERDVRLVDCGDGLQFACLGARPEHRLMLESVYGFLTFKNQVPIGYVLASSLFGSTAVAYNVFETFRKAESALVYGRILAMLKHLFHADAFSVDPYQLGHGNPEGLHSGAWWFYYKLGFRPHDRDIRRLVREELKKMKARPGHRSSLATLTRLTAEPMFYYLEGPRKDVLGRISLGQIGLRISRYLSRRFGAERERGIETCARETGELLGVGSLRGLSRGERLAWERWSPLILALPGIESWDPQDREALISVVRAKGGRRESEFVPLFDRHSKLREAVLELSKER